MKDIPKKIVFLYEKNAKHNVFQLNDKPNQEFIIKVFTKIDNYSKLYFTSFNL